MGFKKIIAFALVLIMLVTSLSACKSNTPEEDGAVKTEDIIDSEPSDNTEEKEEQAEQKEESTQQHTPKEESKEQAQENKEQEKEEGSVKPSAPEKEKEEEQQTPSDINTPSMMDKFDKPEKEEETVVKYDEKNLLKIIDYNIRCSNSDGENKLIVDRAPRLNALIDKYDPDIIGLQEARPSWITQLEYYFSDDYEMRYTYRSESDKESTPILWKKDKFELLDEGHFWLSETPDKESLGWGSKYHRIFNWVKLKVKATGKILIFANTHFTNSDFTVKSAPIIEERLKKVGGFTDYPVILTGDFNCTPWSDGVYSLTEIGLADINDSLGFDFSYTNNGYNERPDDDKNNSIKDYVMHSSDKTMIVPLVYKVLNENYFNGWISDHRGLYTELALL